MNHKKLFTDKDYHRGAGRTKQCCAVLCILAVLAGCGKTAPAVAETPVSSAASSSSPSVPSAASSSSPSISSAATAPSEAQSSSAVPTSDKVVVTAQFLNGGAETIQSLCVSPAGKGQFGANLLGESRIESGAVGKGTVTFSEESPQLDLQVTDANGKVYLLSGLDLSGWKQVAEVNIELSFASDGTGTAAHVYAPNLSAEQTGEGRGTAKAPTRQEQETLLQITCQTWFDLSEEEQSQRFSQMMAWWESVEGYVVPDLDSALQDLTHQAETYNRNQTEIGIFDVACDLNGINSATYTNPLKDQSGEGKG